MELVNLNMIEYLNDAENIKETDEYFNKGDIMLNSNTYPQYFCIDQVIIKLFG